MDTMAIKCRRAVRQVGVKRLVIAGGVGANRRLRVRLAELMEGEGGKVFYPRPAFCTDNGAMIAYAGWRIWCRNPAGLAMQVWFGQLAFNFIWTPVFFGMRLPGLALVVLAAMLALIVLFIRLTWNRDRISAIAFLPYAAWVAFAGLLNLSIWWLN